MADGAVRKQSRKTNFKVAKIKPWCNKINKQNKMKKTNKQEQRKEQRDNAMPSVKQLVKRYGRSIVQSCLNQLADYEKKLRLLATAKKEVERLEKEI